jgi:hypothetical protein
MPITNFSASNIWSQLHTGTSPFINAQVSSDGGAVIVSRRAVDIRRYAGDAFLLLPITSAPIQILLSLLGFFCFIGAEKLFFGTSHSSGEQILTFKSPRKTRNYLQSESLYPSQAEWQTVSCISKETNTFENNHRWQGLLRFTALLAQSHAFDAIAYKWTKKCYQYISTFFKLHLRSS